MKRVLFLTLFISLSSLICKGQEYPDISYEEVESSKDYVNGNEFQKDLLLYSKTFELSHPYYADKKNTLGNSGRKQENIQGVCEDR